MTMNLLRSNTYLNWSYLRRKLRLLIGLRVDPAEGLEVVEVLVLGQHRGQVHGLVGAPLRGQHDATDLLHLETKCT